MTTTQTTGVTLRAALEKLADRWGTLGDPGFTAAGVILKNTLDAYPDNVATLPEYYGVAGSAKIARDNGWAVGTRLVGDEGDGPTVIEITGIGYSAVTALTISRDGKPETYPRERIWSMQYRDWKVTA